MTKGIQGMQAISNLPITAAVQIFGRKPSAGPKGNSEFVSPESLNGNIVVKGKQNSLFPEGPVIKCFVIPPNSKIEKNCEKTSCLMRTLFPEGPVIKCFVIPPDSKIEKNCEKMTLCLQFELYYRNDMIVVFFFAANKNKGSKVALPSFDA